jgi:tetratricopeptide (TPR) repeat protein
MDHDVFISYSSRDKSTADAVCSTLEAARVRCWIAPRDVLPGDDWGGAIVRAIDRSRVMVLVFSASANESKQVRREVRRAFNKELTVIPFRVERVEPCDDLDYYLGSVHWLDALTPPLEQHLRSRAARVRLLVPERNGARVPQDQDDRSTTAKDAVPADARPSAPPPAPEGVKAPVGPQTPTEGRKPSPDQGSERSPEEVGVEREPKDALSFHNRGETYDRKGDYDRAIADFTEAIRLDPNFALAYRSRGAAYHAKGDYDRAVADSTEAIRLNPGDAVDYRNRGRAYHSKGDYDRAVADFTEAIRLDPNDANGYEWRSLAYSQKWNFFRAMADRAEAKRLGR